jgi:hypothetical protein
MRSSDEVRRAFCLRSDGLSIAAVSRATGVSRSQLRAWFEAGEASTLDSPMRGRSSGCPTSCGARDDLDRASYAYLLGQYLGDGCISRMRSTYKLRISCCDAYPGIMDEVEEAMRAVLPNVVGRIPRVGCTEVGSTSNHWPCVIPQHGPGVKHRRRITVEPWQHEIAIECHPELLLRGLIHSDGWRGINRVVRRGKTYEYSRYLFSNRSEDIHSIFAEACSAVGVECRRNNLNSTSVARRESVERLDQFIGPKR